MPNDLIKITRERLQALIRIEVEYYALHDAGVDNWEGYQSIDWDEVEQLQDASFEEVASL